ncbi:MAG: hypothetical protein ACI4P3_02820 [Candidatus Spyradosoma sp.]
MADDKKFPPPEELLPHKPPMVLVERVLSCDFENRVVETEILVSEKSLFFDSALGGVPAYAVVEYFAQSIGCFAGLYDLSQNPPKNPGIGFVLGTRRFDSAVPALAPGRWRVRAHELFFDSEIASFDCALLDSTGATLCSAVLNAYRPVNLEQFKADMKKALS